MSEKQDVQFVDDFTLNSPTPTVVSFNPTDEALVAVYDLRHVVPIADTVCECLTQEGRVLCGWKTHSDLQGSTFNWERTSFEWAYIVWPTDSDMFRVCVGLLIRPGVYERHADTSYDCAFECFEDVMAYVRYQSSVQPEQKGEPT